MGIGRFLKSLVNPQVMGEEIIATQEKAYHYAQRKYPDADPHFLLAQVWLSRMAARRINSMNEMMQKKAFSETMHFACLQPLENVRALGLFFIHEERPDIFQICPLFGLEFSSIMSPVLRAMTNGGIEELYQRYNPKNGQIK